MTSLAKPPRFALTNRSSGQLTLASQEGDAARIFVLENDLIRVLLLPGGRLAERRTYAIAPGDEDTPLDGRDRFDLSGFALPDFLLVEDDKCLRIETKAIRLMLALDGFYCSFELRIGTEWRPAARDRATQAYNFGWWDERVYHYLRRERDEKYFGLGERAGDMDRAGKRYRLANTDAMGYDARTSDPLYKHIPFYISWRQEDKLAFGLFYDTLSDCTFDFGKELDNYHGLYRSFIADHGDLDYYFIAGPGVDQVTRRFTWLTGRPAFTPKWGLGYSGSSMAYTDAPNAQSRMTEFLDRCAEHDILCDSFHLSSGYTSIGDRRYVFHWNRAKFSDPSAFVQTYLKKGIRLCANVKPCLLHGHPLLPEAVSAGLLIASEDGEPAWAQFWDGIGAYLDFTQPKTLAWWKARLKECLLRYGISSIWNDNNEFEIRSAAAVAHGFGDKRPACGCKPLQTLLMMRASRDAQKEHLPNKRPFLVSRSGGVGMQRYVQTWSGDNFTSWETLKYNLKMGLGLALSGVSNSGHDIGGFSGPAPDPELFVRWVQFGLFMPRFSIHSWNDDGSVNEPWMHPETIGVIRDLIKLRYHLIPYFYDLLWRYHRDYEPVVRPVFYDFADDPCCWRECDEMMVGASLLVAPVVEPGIVERATYLPSGTRWYDFWTGEVFDGGQSIRRSAPWTRPVLFARENSVIPVNIAKQSFSRREDRRGFIIFPPVGVGSLSYENFEDDGETDAYLRGECGGWRIQVDADADAISVRAEAVGMFPGRDATPFIKIPELETRRLQIGSPGSAIRQGLS